MTFALHPEVAGACLLFTLPPKSPVQMTNSLLPSINAIYLSIPAGGLTSNVILGGREEREEKERERGGWGEGERAKESMKQAREGEIGSKWPMN